MEWIEFDLDLPDEKFWENYLENQIEVRKKFRLVMDHMTRIGAPKEIDLELRKTFPLVIYQNGSPKDLYYYDLESSGLIATVDIERNRLFYSIALEMPEYKPYKEETSDQSYATLDNHMVNLQTRLRMDLKPGKYLTIIINRDDVSNRVLTSIKPAVGFYKDKEVEKFIEEERQKLELPPIWPPLKQPVDRALSQLPYPLPIYTEYPGVPDPPSELGISVAATRVQYADSEATCLVQGSFRLPFNYGRLARPKKNMDEQSWSSDSLRVPIHIIITGSKTSNPFAKRMIVPVYNKTEKSDETKEMVGYFTFNILKYVNLVEVPQTYFMYFFSGEIMTGPVPISFVDRKEVE